MAQTTHYTPNVDFSVISLANNNRDGSGILYSVLTGASNGTIVKTVIIKALTNTTEGAIRLFLYNGSINALLAEIPVPSITKSSRNPSFEVSLDLDLFLKSGYNLKVSTQNADTFVITALGSNVSYTTTPVTDDIQYEALNCLGELSVANPNLNGSGTLVTLFDFNLVGWTGIKIEKIHIKAIGTTTPGMVRLFLNDSGARLFTEIPVPAITPTATAQSFEHTIHYTDFCLPPGTGTRIYASTENAENFVITIEALLYKYLY